MAKKFYQIADKLDSRKIAEFLSRDGQLLLPFLELICNAEQALAELVDLAGSGNGIRQLSEGRFDEIDIPAIYIDGIQFGDCHVIVATGSPGWRRQHQILDHGGELRLGHFISQIGMV